MINRLKTLMPHAVAVLALLLLAVFYCKPVLDNKILSQSDNVQWQAMAKESIIVGLRYPYSVILL